MPLRALEKQVCGEKFLWIPGQWKWDVTQKNYHWEDGKCVKRKRNYKWVEGKWKKAELGWIWVPGRWENFHMNSKKREFKRSKSTI